MSQKNHYTLTGPQDDYDIPKQSLGKIIYDLLQRRTPEEIINEDARTKKVLTCGEFLKNSKSYANLYKKLGIQKDDTITILSENTIDYFIPVVGAFYMGITVNLLNPNYSYGELQSYISIVKPKLILSSETALNTISNIKEELIRNVPVLLMNITSNNNPLTACPEDILSENTSDLDDFKPVGFDYTDQAALLLFSSGTTGLPKGVRLTHQNLRMAIGLFSHPEFGNTIPGDVHLIIPPFYHIYGSLIQLIGLLTSTTCVILEKFKPEVLLESIQEYKVTMFYAVPSLLLFLVQSSLVKNYNLSSIRHIFVGSAPLSKEVESQTNKLLPSVRTIQLYGLTEVAGPCVMQNKDKFGSVGCLAPGMSAKVINPETTTPLGPLEVGEICFKGLMLMKGYIPEKNYLDEDGFFRTGDAGYYDHDGFFYVVDRYKELIKYKGFQVPPAELEALIISHSAVKECAVTGMPDERAGELATAFVILKEGANCTEQELKDFVAERISYQKRLHGGVRFIEELPRSTIGKISRRALKEMV